MKHLRGYELLGMWVVLAALALIRVDATYAMSNDIRHAGWYISVGVGANRWAVLDGRSLNSRATIGTPTATRHGIVDTWPAAYAPVIAGSTTFTLKQALPSSLRSDAPPDRFASSSPLVGNPSIWSRNLRG